jgi:hypothetical protein
VGAPASTAAKKKLPSIGELETQGRCAPSVLRFTCSPTALKVWKISRPLVIVSDRPRVYVAVFAVLRHVAGLDGVGDQGTFRRLHLGKAAATGSQATAAERIVPASI